MADNGVSAISIAVLSAVLKIALLVAVGIKLEKQGMLNGPKRKCLSALAMEVCLPCLLFSDVLPEADVTLFDEGWELLLWPVFYAAVGALTGVLVCCLVGTPSQHLGSAAACAAFPNVNGFPVSIISALGPALPKSPLGFSPMTFLALIQLTDGCIKYTLGPAVFRRDLRAVKRARLQLGKGGTHEDLPLGASLRSLEGANSVSNAELDRSNSVPIDSTSVTDGAVNGAAAILPPPPNQSEQPAVTDFGLTPRQYKSVEPDWSRFESGKLIWSTSNVTDEVPSLQKPLLDGQGGSARKSLHLRLMEASRRLTVSTTSMKDVVQQLLPPQVTAVVLALAIGMGPDWVKQVMYDPALAKSGGQPPLGFVYGTAKALGGGFVPLQMISLGGRLLNIVGADGPLASKGEAGPRGRSKLLRISFAVAFARMIVAPVILYGIALCADRAYLRGRRPLAFWAPALIVSAMPTANNMSTMADLVGSGRSISAASTAVQLLASPLLLAVSLTFLIAGARFDLAAGGV